MSLINLIYRAIQSKKRDLIFLVVNTAIIILFYYLLFENSEVIYPLMLSGFIILIYIIVEIIKII